MLGPNRRRAVTEKLRLICVSDLTAVATAAPKVASNLTRTNSAKKLGGHSHLRCLYEAALIGAAPWWPIAPSEHCQSVGQMGRHFHLEYNAK